MHTKYVSAFFLSLCFAFGMTTAARADGIDNFTITYNDYFGPGTFNEVYTFSLPSNATPDCVGCVTADSFTFDNVAYNAYGDPDPADGLSGPGTDTETFFTTAYQSTAYFDYSFDNSLGGIVAFPSDQQYFSGDVSDPTFIPGTYYFTYGDGESSPDGTLVITAQTPEPSSILLLGTGVIGAIAAACRRRSSPILS